MDDKKDVGVVREISINGISRAALNKNPKLAAILEFIVKELDKQFPEETINKESN